MTDTPPTPASPALPRKGRVSLIIATVLNAILVVSLLTMTNFVLASDNPDARIVWAVSMAASAIAPVYAFRMWARGSGGFAQFVAWAPVVSAIARTIFVG